MILILAAACVAAEGASERIVDCGTAAVYCLCRFQGADTDFPQVRAALAPCGSPPYSMADLQQALAKLGVATNALAASGEELPDRTPFLAYQQTGAVGHFSVCRLDRAENVAELVDVRESWQGTPRDLVRRPGWTGVALIPTRPQWPRYAALAGGLGFGAADATIRRRHGAA